MGNVPAESTSTEPERFFGKRKVRKEVLYLIPLSQHLAEGLPDPLSEEA
jgi:hypothetical protein